MSVFGLTQTLPRMFELATLEVPGFTSVECPPRNATIALQSSDIGLVNDSVSVLDWPWCVLVSSVTVPNDGLAPALMLLLHLAALACVQKYCRPSAPTNCGAPRLRFL